MGNDLGIELEVVAVPGAARELHRAPHRLTLGGLFHHRAGQRQARAAVERTARAHELVRDLDAAPPRPVDDEAEELAVFGTGLVAHHLNVALRADLRRVDLRAAVAGWVEGQSNQGTTTRLTTLPIALRGSSLTKRNRSGTL